LAFLCQQLGLVAHEIFLRKKRLFCKNYCLSFINFISLSTELARVRKILDEKVSVMEKMLADMEPLTPDDDNRLAADPVLLPEQDKSSSSLSPEDKALAPETELIRQTVMDQLSSSLQREEEDEGQLPPSLATFPLVLQLSDLDCPKFCINIQVKFGSNYKEECPLTSCQVVPVFQSPPLVC
jgi:hypothetical protein